MDITVVELLVPQTPSTPAQAALLVLRVFLGLCFIRHGWPKLRNLKTWATAMQTPEWLCFLSAFSMWGAGIALIPGLLTPLAALAILVSMAYAVVIEIKSGFPFIAPDPYQIPAGDYAGPMGVGEPPQLGKSGDVCGDVRGPGLLRRWPVLARQPDHRRTDPQPVGLSQAGLRPTGDP